MDITQYNNVPREDIEIVQMLRKYSITGDIIAYRLCPRQYGLFKIRNIVPSAQGQMFYGQIIHSVLDKAHLHYKGEYSKTKGTIPTEDEIDSYFDSVAKALRSQGIKPLSKGLEDRARKLIKIFINKFGNFLFPRVKDTEHRLEIQSSLNDGTEYILHGVVDVLLESDDSSEEESVNLEIWDYKGGRKPEGRYLEDYTFQMQVYTHLFYLRNGFFPSKVILFFIGELDQKENKNLTLDDLFDNSSISVEAGEKLIQQAMNAFRMTVQTIEREYTLPFKDQWFAPTNKPPTQMCETCELRWSCQNPNGDFKLSGL